MLGLSPSCEDGLPTLLEGLVPETRHADGRHPHSCGPGADRRIAELGSYGVQYYLNL